MNDQESRAIYSSLANAFDDRTVIANAFNYWQQNRADGELDVVQVVEQLNAYLGLGTAEKKALMIGLYNNIKKRVDELPSLPSFLSAGLNAVKGEDLSPEQTYQRSTRPVFVQLSEQFLSETFSQMSLRKLDFKEIEAELTDVGLAVDSGQVVVLEHGSGGLRLSDKTSEEECQELLHAYYLLLSEVIGPVEADLVFQDSMQTIRKSETAKSYDPRKLLV